MRGNVSDTPTVVIVGASLAGSRCAETLRQGGFAGRIILIGEETERPYNRPPLSKEWLGGDYPEDQLYLRSFEYYAEEHIELRLGVRATALDTAARLVTLDTGEQVGYDFLLIATGVRARRLSLPGADLAGIHYLRTIADSDRIRAEMTTAQHAVVVGGGFIGAEIAAGCRARDIHVTMIEILDVPMKRVTGTEVGEILAGYHRKRGVEILTNESVTAFSGDASGHVASRTTASGKTLPCDFAVVGIGGEPVVDWLAGSGVEVNNGVVVNEYCETNVPNVYAAGDVANTFSPMLGHHIRVEHDTNAQNQGGIVARAILGNRSAYNPVHFVWSDQYDMQIQYVGHATAWDQVALRGDVEGQSFIAFYLQDGKCLAALGVSRPREVNFARRLIQSGATLDPAKLADEDVAIPDAVVA